MSMPTFMLKFCISILPQGILFGAYFAFTFLSISHMSIVFISFLPHTLPLQLLLCPHPRLPLKFMASSSVITLRSQHLIFTFDSFVSSLPFLPCKLTSLQIFLFVCILLRLYYFFFFYKLHGFILTIFCLLSALLSTMKSLHVYCGTFPIARVAVSPPALCAPDIAPFIFVL